MTQLSININKIALLRNSRGRNFPDVQAFAARCLSLGVHGITLHPRPDQRHARYDDIALLSNVCKEYDRELNVEGNPTPEFIEQVKRVRPAQCTLVPDDPTQLTSDHGWDIRRDESSLRDVIAQLKDLDIRVSLFVDFDYPYIEAAKEVGADRVELYTEPYAELFAESFGKKNSDVIVAGFKKAALRAQAIGLGVNAGHDLSLQNLANFLEVPNILEVSIGHAFVVECLEQGIESVVSQYLSIIKAA